MTEPSNHHLLTVDRATDHVQGPFDAKLKLIEYGDFECPSCGQAHAAVKILREHFHTRVQFVFRHFPLREVHPQAELAAEAAEAAGAQGQFWAMHDKLFEHQRHLDESHLVGYARELGLDLLRFENELRDHVYLQRVQEQIAVAEQLRVRSTPTFYVNDQLVDVSMGLDRLRKAVEDGLARA